MNPLTEDDFTVINLNDLHKGSPFGASSRNPTALVIWNDITPEEAIELRDKILAWQKDHIKIIPRVIEVEQI